RFGDRARQAQLVAIARTIRVDAVDNQLAGAELHSLAGPVHGIHAGPLAPAVGDDLVELALGVPQDVHGQHDALRAKAIGALGDQVGIEHRLRIYADFVGAGTQQVADLIGCA